MAREASEDASVVSIRGIDFIRSAAKELRKIPHRDRERILDRIEAFADNPDLPHHDVKVLATSKARRLRVSDYRVLMTPSPGGRFTVERVAHRREVYR
ncbi:MAG: type II toxin-antitoxin system RelE family toxin [Acetobacteraceae bacterium]